MRHTSLPGWLYPTEGEQVMEWIWAILIVLVAAMWLLALIDIIRRRHTMSGGKIAAWVIAILVFPVAGAIAYFLVHGVGGGEAAPRQPIP
jgi:Phospholipase_D-nuclease N-terminal